LWNDLTKSHAKVYLHTQEKLVNDLTTSWETFFTSCHGRC
jgi:hypothetical protein